MLFPLVCIHVFLNKVMGVIVLGSGTLRVTILGDVFPSGHYLI